VVVSIYVHRERVGEAGVAPSAPAAPSEPTAVETTQTAPRSPTHSHPQPRDLEEEMIEEDYQRHSVEQVRSPPEPEGHDTSHVEHGEQGGERLHELDDRGARQHFNIEV
jgi:hypothetical protein